MAYLICPDCGELVEPIASLDDETADRPCRFCVLADEAERGGLVEALNVAWRVRVEQLRRRR